jgi:hypothetical protein
MSLPMTDASAKLCPMADAAKLVRVKLAHTAIWAFMAGAIVALPYLGWTRHFGLAAAVTALVVGEGVVLAFNRGHCPLTDVAARYTTERADNFDIYLPLTIAR